MRRRIVASVLALVLTFAGVMPVYAEEVSCEGVNETTVDNVTESAEDSSVQTTPDENEGIVFSDAGDAAEETEDEDIMATEASDDGEVFDSQTLYESSKKFENGDYISSRTDSRYVEMISLINGYKSLSDDQKARVIHLLEKSNYRPIDGEGWPCTNQKSYITSINDGTYDVKWGIAAKGCLSYSRYAVHLIYGNNGGEGASDTISSDGLKEYILKYAQPGEQIYISNWNTYTNNGKTLWNPHDIVFLAANDNGFYTVSYYAVIDNSGNEISYAPRIYFWSYDFFAGQMGQTGAEVKLYNINTETNTSTATVEEKPSELAIGLIYNGHAYQLFDKGGYTWTMAKAYCDSIGGHLVTITDEDEQKFIESLLVMGYQKQYWIGLYRQNDNDKLTWVTGEDYSYHSSWGYLDKTHRSDGQYENYCQIYRVPNPHASSSKLGTWNDMYYDNTYPGEENYFNINNVGFICEWEDVPTGYAEKTGTTFTDVDSSAYYYEAVKYAYFKEITSGTSATTFSPNENCTRAQVVTFLWRANGSPEVDIASPFTDVQDPNKYYYKAVLWAVSKGITSGTTATTFSPNDKVTRAQFVTFLWRAQGEPSHTSRNPFNDLGSKNSYYYDAVLWASQNGVTSGTSKTTFEPSAACTRGQVVTFIYRDLN